MFTFGDHPVLDPLLLFDQCQGPSVPPEKRLPVDAWWGKANSVVVPLGCAPGTGTILLTREALNDLRPETPEGQALRDIEVHDGINPKIKFPGWLIVGHAAAATPGFEADPATAYVVQIADERWLYWERGAKINAAYNVRSDSSGAYLTGTLDAGFAWTWDNMVAQLWPSGLGLTPTLPFTPDGVPEGFIFRSKSKLQALDEVLTRLCCALKRNPVSGTYTIVRLGVADSGADRLTEKYADKRLWEPYPVTWRVASWPETIQVRFRVKPPYGTGADPWYAVDQTVTTYPAQGIADGTVLVLEDDLYAQQSGGSVTNSADLTARTTERRTDWERKRLGYDRGECRVYGGAVDLSLALGARWGKLAWEDRGPGFKTTVASGDNAPGPLEKWRRETYYPENMAARYDKRGWREPGRYYQAAVEGLVNRTDMTVSIATLGDTKIVLIPFIVPRAGTVSAIRMELSAAAADPSNVVRMGLYAATSTTSILATTLVVDAGQVSADGPGFATATIAEDLDPGLYWIAIGLDAGDIGYAVFVFYVSEPETILTPAEFDSSYALLGQTDYPYSIDGDGARAYKVPYPNGSGVGALPATLDPTSVNLATDGLLGDSGSTDAIPLVGLKFDSFS